jgi:hypothetical protein
MNDEELMLKIEQLTKDYKGDISHFYEVVGMVVVGRLFGWRVIRLVSTDRSWAFACRLFGDLKELLPERGRYAYKSVGLQMVDRLFDYWEVVKRQKSLPMVERRIIQ